MKATTPSGAPTGDSAPPYLDPQEIIARGESALQEQLNQLALYEASLKKKEAVEGTIGSFSNVWTRWRDFTHTTQPGSEHDASLDRFQEEFTNALSAIGVALQSLGEAELEPIRARWRATDHSKNFDFWFVSHNQNALGRLGREQQAAAYDYARALVESVFDEKLTCELLRPALESEGIRFALTYTNCLLRGIWGLAPHVTALPPAVKKNRETEHSVGTAPEILEYANDMKDSLDADTEKRDETLSRIADSLDQDDSQDSAPSTSPPATKEHWSLGQLILELSKGERLDRHQIPGLARIELLCDLEPGAPGVNEEKVRRLRARICLQQHWETSHADQLELTEAADIHQGVKRVSLDELQAASQSSIHLGLCTLDRISFGADEPIQVTGLSCKVIAGTTPTVCPKANPPLPPGLLALAEKAIRRLNQLPVGTTIHWVGHDTGYRNRCPCHPDAPFTAPFDKHRWASVGSGRAIVTANEPVDEPSLKLIRVFTNGISDDRIGKAVQVLTDEKLTANEKLKKIDTLIPFPATASAEQLGEMLGVSKQAVARTDWWAENRSGEKENEIGRRRANHKSRAKNYEPPSTEDSD